MTAPKDKTRKGDLGCPNCDGPCIGCWDDMLKKHDKSNTSPQRADAGNMTLRDRCMKAAREVDKIAGEAHRHGGCVTPDEIADAIESIAKAERVRFAERAMREIFRHRVVSRVTTIERAIVAAIAAAEASE